MGKKAVFFDIDGTLYDFKIGVPDSAKKAIKMLRDNGHYAFLSTGRTRAFINDEVILSIGFDGMCAGCGTYITYGSDILLEKKLNKEVVDQTLKILDKYNIFPVLEGSRWLYFDREEYYDRKLIDFIFDEKFDGRIKSIKGNENNIEINKMTLHMTNTEKKEVDKVMEILKRDYDLIRHDTKFIEIAPKGFSKGTGIKYLCDYLGISLKDTYGVGDSSNDIDMFNVVNTAIAMGNGTEDAKIHADYVTDTLENNGIYKALGDMHLINV